VRKVVYECKLPCSQCGGEQEATLEFFYSPCGGVEKCVITEWDCYLCGSYMRKEVSPAEGMEKLRAWKKVWGAKFVGNFPA